MKSVPTPILIAVLVSTFCALPASADKKSRKPSNAPPPTAQQLTEAYNGVFSAITKLSSPPAAKTPCGLGNLETSVCFKGNGNCVITLTPGTQGYFKVDVVPSSDSKPDWNSGCEASATSESVKPLSMTFSVDGPNVRVGFTLRSAGEGEGSSVDHCAVTVTGRVVQATMNGYSAVCML